MSYKNFELALRFLYKAEGGYSNNPYDLGGATNLGVTQSTYNSYRRRHNLPIKNVKFITLEESKKIYYEDYWLASGADKITNPRMAILLFDTAVLHGVYKAKEFYKKSDGNIDKFLLIRRKSYDNIVLNNPSQKKFYNGWINRVNNIRNYISNINENLEQDEVELVPILYGYIQTSDVEEVPEDNKLQKDMNILMDDKEYNNETYCPGSYPVSGYVRSDGTKVSGYVRNCYKHSNGKTPPKTLHNLPKEEMEKWIRELI